MNKNLLPVPEQLEKRTLILPGALDELMIEARLNLLTSLISDAKDFMRYMDEHRQRSLNVALIIFAGLVSFSVTLKNPIATLLVYLVLMVTMIVLAIDDRRKHKTSHAWRHSWFHLIHRTNSAIQNPQNPIEIEVYRKKGEDTAELWSLIPKLYYGLNVISIILFLVCAICFLCDIPFPFLILDGGR